MSRSRAAAWAARAVAVVLPCAAGAYGLLRSDSVLAGGLAWLIALAAAVAGLGHVVEQIARVRVDLGLRMTWGAGAYLAVAGVGFAAGVMSSPVVLGLIAVGLAGYAWRQLTVEQPALTALLATVRSAFASPPTGMFALLIVALIAVNVAGGVAEQQGNTYDDDVAYTPLVKRALDTGNIDEPFSFRRISAYGGQTALGELAAVRGTLANIYLVDTGLFQIITLLMVLAMARRRDQDAPAGAGLELDHGGYAIVGLTFLVLGLLPNSSINTGPYWSAVAFFLALYRTAALTAEAPVDAPPPIRLFAILGGLGAATCSLRQNCLPVALLFILLVLVFRLGREPRARFRTERAAWLATIVAGGLALAPWCIASWRSNHTILFPIFKGTFNPQISTQPTLQTVWQELQFYIRVISEPEPVRVMLVLLPVLLVARDQRRGRPLTAMIVASFVGFALLIHSFTLSDQHHLWRYSFGFMMVLFVALVVEGGAPGLRPIEDRGRWPVYVPLLGRVAIAAALVVQLALSAKGIAKKYDNLAADLDLASRVGSTDPLDEKLTYARLQTAVPAGATIAIALDRPYFLDYARNPIINLDTPGFASFSPGMPFFRGPGPVVDYFRSHGIRYLGFVRGGFSRYQYRREFWVRRIYTDTELWRMQGAYAVDCLDNFDAIAATHRVAYEHDGMVLVDLEAAP